MAKTTVPIELSSTPSIVDNGNATAITIDSSQNVGISTSSPAKKLAVKADGGGSQLGIDIHNEGTATGDDSVISFETQGSREFTMGLDRSATSFVIAEAGDLNSNQRLVIDDSGNVGIGITNPSDYYASWNDLVLGSTSAAGGMTIVSGTGSDGTLAFADGTTGDAEYRGYIQYAHSGDSLRIGTAGSERWRIESNGHLKAATNGIGINFDASEGSGATSTVLDDYEEGTWTVSLSASVTNPTIASIANTTGYYTKIGNLVYFQYYSGAINISSAGSGYAYISLPFVGISNQYGLINVTHTTCFNVGVDGGYTSSSDNLVVFMDPQPSTNAAVWTTGNPKYLMVQGVYRTTA